jgi:hypothetical protein
MYALTHSVLIEVWALSMFELNAVSPFINQHLRTTICEPNHISVSAPTRFGISWHHLQGAPSNRQFFAAPPPVANSLVDRSLQDHRLFNTDTQLRMSLNFLRQCVCQCRLKQKLYILEVMNHPKFGAVRQFCGLLLHDVCVVPAGWGPTELHSLPFNTLTVHLYGSGPYNGDEKLSVIWNTVASYCCSTRVLSKDRIKPCHSEIWLNTAILRGGCSDWARAEQA